MADTFDKATRSWLMGRVKSRGNLSTEKRLAEIFRAQKISGWRRGWPLFGKPDFVFPRVRLAVFVDGCFWHGCPIHGTMPASNRAFWRKKITGNMRRDRATSRRLRAMGWHVFRIWEHELGKPPLNRKLGRIRAVLRGD